MNLSKAAILLLLVVEPSVGLGGRERISTYVASGQQFLVFEILAMPESPGANVLSRNS